MYSTALAAYRAEDHLQGGHAVVQGPEHRNTSPLQPPHTVRGAFARLALHCWHNLPGERTSQHEASVTRHLLSGSHFLGQYLIVPHWQFLNLGLTLRFDSLQFQCVTLWPWTCLASCVRLWDNFYQVWPSTTYGCLNYSVFNVDTLCHAVTLTFDLVILKVRGTSSVVWSKYVRKLSEIE